MNLEEWLAQRQEEHNEFQKWWLEESEKAIETYPKDLNYLDWEEQFQFYTSEKS